MLSSRGDHYAALHGRARQYLLLPFFVAERSSRRHSRLMCTRYAAAFLFPCVQFLRRWAVYALDPIWVSSAEGRLSVWQHMRPDLPGVRGLPWRPRMGMHVRLGLGLCARHRTMHCRCRARGRDTCNRQSNFCGSTFELFVC
jgi:hypothetical protein